jgi:polyphosphate kinase
MPRNFDRRVEVMTPIEDPGLHKGLEAVLATCLADNRQAWELNADGQYRRREPAAGAAVHATQSILMKEPWGTVAGRPPKRKKKGA